MSDFIVTPMSETKAPVGKAEHVDVQVRIPAEHVERFRDYGARLYLMRDPTIALSLILRGLDAADAETKVPQARRKAG